MVLLTVLLFYMGYKSLMSGIKKFKEENALKASQKEKTELLELNENPKNDDQNETIGESPVRKRTTASKSEKDQGFLPSINQAASSDLKEEAKQEGEVVEEEKTSDEELNHSQQEHGDQDKEHQVSDKKDMDLVQQSPALLKILNMEKTHFQWSKLIIFFVVFIALVISSLLRGNKRLDSIIGIETCSWGDWLIYGLFVLLILGLTIHCGLYLKRLYLKKIRNSYTFVDGDMKWTIGKIVKMIGFGVLTGLSSGGLGRGGGVSFNPLFIELGIPPAIASATGMYLVMFSTITNSFLYGISGLLYFNWGIWLGTITSIGSIFGLKLMNKAIKKTGRVSLLVLLMAGVILVSAVIIPVNSLF